MRTSSKPATILVIEDYAPIRSLLEAVLQAEGYHVLCAEDGKVGCNLARQHRPDAITLDIAMPGLDGLGVLSCLKADDTTKGIPVVIVSAFGEQLEQDAAKKAAAVIPKPFTIIDLTKTLATLLPGGHPSPVTSFPGNFAGSGC